MQSIRKILRLSHPLHTWIILACVLITVHAVLQQAMPITLKFVVDELTQQISSGTGEYNQVISLFALILGINFSAIILNSINQRIGDHISSRLGKYLTEQYYHKIFTLPQQYFDTEISGKMITQLNRGIFSIQDFVGSATNFILPAVLQAVFGIIILSYYDWGIGLLALAVFPMYIAISSYSTKKWGELQGEKNVIEDATRGRIQEVISNIRLIKTYVTHRQEWEYVSKNYSKYTAIYDRQSTQYHLLNFFREFGLEFALIIILFLVIRKTFIGEFSLGEMVLIFQLLNQLRWPLFGMSYILEQVQRAEADSKAFFEVLELPSTEQDLPKKLPPLVQKPTVELQQVSFAYEAGVPVLKDVSVKLKPGETVALIGHSGAGKTTLINLILKLYEPTAGRLVLSGSDYSKVPHEWVRQHMALVFQDTELFSSTIRENVAYGMPDATDAEITTALKQANAYDFIRKFPKQLDAEIGERGVKLSGGQKQRIQIARAILHDKPILILDEATSSLDSKSEHLVQEALEKLFKNRLVIIIAHRFSTIQNVDRIVVLDSGTIADVGTPQELSQREGVYAELLQYQLEGNKKLLKKYELV